MMRITVDKWKDFCQEFAGFFQHINALERTDEQVTFRSPVNRVSTHLVSFETVNSQPQCRFMASIRKFQAIFNNQEKCSTLRRSRRLYLQSPVNCKASDEHEAKKKQNESLQCWKSSIPKHRSLSTTKIISNC